MTSGLLLQSLGQAKDAALVGASKAIPGVVGKAWDDGPAMYRGVAGATRTVANSRELRFAFLYYLTRQ